MNFFDNIKTSAFDPQITFENIFKNNLKNPLIIGLGENPHRGYDYFVTFK